MHINVPSAVTWNEEKHFQKLRLTKDIVTKIAMWAMNFDKRPHHM